MSLFGLTFLLYFLKLSAGNGFYKVVSIAETALPLVVLAKLTRSLAALA